MDSTGGSLPVLHRRLLRSATVAAVLLGVVLCLGPADSAAQRPAARSNPSEGGPLRPESLLPAAPPDRPADPAAFPGALNPEEMLSPQGLPAMLKILALLTVISLAPSILIMTTCFIRFVIVLGLLRQALGTQQLPPNQVVVSLSLFLTFLVMAPVWQQAYQQGIVPYTDPERGQAAASLEQSFDNTVQPLRRFMSEQIEAAGNSDAVWMFVDFQRPDQETSAGRDWQPPENYEQVPLSALLPAYLLSELKVAFIIGFQLYLPFLVIDMVVASVLISMGMMMLPPVLISLPFKLLLFVLIDGWYLVVGMLLQSVG
ncbi:MAG: flagellar type III secretion system pore protein FliP [Planctomycetales bacterium]